MSEMSENGQRPVIIIALKTMMNQERKAASMLADRVDPDRLRIFSILLPMKIRGYLFIETEDIDYNTQGELEGVDTEGKKVGRVFVELKRMTDGIKYIRGVVEKETDFKEIEGFLKPKATVVGIEVGDIVELVSGPFKNEKGRVKHIDSTREEITVELLESIVPIPVKVRGDTVRVLQKEE